MKILHLTTDEKFIDGAMFTFEKAFPAQNNLLVLKPPANPSIRYIKKSRINYHLIRSEDTLREIESLINKFDWLIIHGLNDIWSRLILKSNDLNFLYVIWGAEIYGNPLIYNKSLYGPRTQDIAHSSRKSLLKGIKDYLNRFRFKVDPISTNELFNLNKNALAKVKNIAILYKEEVEFYKTLNIIKEDTRYVKFGYYPIEYFTSSIDLSNPLGSNILIGNSASLSNNHFEVFDILKSISVNNRIIAPLSYGDKQLRDKVIQHGNHLFGERFQALTKFLSLEEYTSIMYSCNVVIMNHYRQQAVGNIISAVYLGAKVFLNPRNSIYSYLINMGCFVYNLNTELKEVSDLAGLSPNQVEHNRAILKADINCDVFASSLKSLIK